MFARIQSLHWAITMGLSMTMLVGTAASATALASNTTKSEWRYYGYDQERTNYNAVETAFTSATVKNLKPVWSVPPMSVYGGDPVTANGMLYGMGYNTSKLVALDVASYHVIWSRQFPTKNQYNPLQMDGPGALIASYSQYSNTLSMVGGIQKLAIPGGKTIWSYRMNAWPHLGIMLHGVDYYTADGGNLPFTTMLTALDDATGKVLWTRKLRSFLSHDVITDGENLYIAGRTLGPGFKFGNFIESYTTNGKLRWSYSPSPQDYCQGPLTLSTQLHLLYTSCNLGNTLAMKLYAFAPDTGALKWTAKIKHGNTFSIATNNHLLFVASRVWKNQVPAHILALDALTGASIWQVTLSADLDVEYFTITGDVLFVTSSQLTAHPSKPSKLTAYNVATGAKLWSITGKSTIYIDQPIIAEGKLFVTIDNRLTAFAPQ